MLNKLSDYFPILTWGRTYKGETFVNDGIAAVIVTIMLIPQSLAYLRKLVYTPVFCHLSLTQYLGPAAHLPLDP